MPHLDLPDDPAAVRALASAVLEAAIRDAQAEPRTDAGVREREDAVSFLCDPADRRLETWTAALGVDPDAMRSRMRRRLGWKRREAA